jgi:hypothetical protein
MHEIYFAFDLINARFILTDDFRHLWWVHADVDPDFGWWHCIDEDCIADVSKIITVHNTTLIYTVSSPKSRAHFIWFSCSGCWRQLHDHGQKCKQRFQFQTKEGRNKSTNIKIGNL